MKLRAGSRPAPLPPAAVILAALSEDCPHPGCDCHAAARRGRGATHCLCHVNLNTPALSVWDGKDGGMAECKSGCDWRTVKDAIRRRFGLDTPPPLPSQRTGRVGKLVPVPSWENERRPDAGEITTTAGNARRPSAIRPHKINPHKTDLPDHKAARKPQTPLDWLATYCGVPLDALAALPVQADGDALAFTFGAGMPRKRRQTDEKAFSWSGGSPSPWLWPPPASTLSADVWVCEGETDAIVVLAAGLPTVAVTKGANATPPGDVFRDLTERGARRLIVTFDTDTPGRDGALKLATAARSAGLVAVTLDLAEIGVLPEGGKDIRDAWLAARSHGDALAAFRERLETAVTTEARAHTPPPYPVYALPTAIRRFVEIAAASLDCPPEYLALPVLAGAAGCIGHRFWLRLSDTWTEYPVLWLAVVGEPGTGKTPAATQSRRPLAKLQQDAHAAYQTALTAYETAMEGWKSRKKDAPPQERPQKPEEEHYFSTDATLEGVVRILGVARSVTPGFVMWRDEIVSFVKSFDAYRSGRGGDRQNWLGAWSSTVIKSDRAGRESFLVDTPCVSVAGGVQPEKLAELLGEAGEGDGFIERFLFAWPDAEPMGFIDGAILPDEVVRGVTSLFHTLRHGAAPGPVRLTSEAKAIFSHWHADNVRMQEGATGLVRGCYAKLPAHAARLALVLHCIEYADDPREIPLSAETMAAALEIVEYHRAHALRVYERFGIHATVQSSAALRIMRAVQDRTDTPLSRTELHAAVGRNLTAAALDTALTQLEAAGLIEPADRSVVATKPGRRAELWHVRRNERNEETPAALPISSFLSFLRSGDPESGGRPKTVISLADGSAADRPDEPSAGRCPTCDTVYPTSAPACFHCNERICSGCGGMTGSSLRLFCFPCISKGAEAAGPSDSA